MRHPPLKRCTFADRWDFERQYGILRDDWTREDAERCDRVVGAFIALCEGRSKEGDELVAHLECIPEVVAGLRRDGFAPTPEQIQDPPKAWREVVQSLLENSDDSREAAEMIRETLCHIPLDLSQFRLKKPKRRSWLDIIGSWGARLWS